MGQKPQIGEAPHLKEGEQLGLPVGQRVFLRCEPRQSRSAHSRRALSRMGVKQAALGPCSRCPNLGGHQDSPGESQGEKGKGTVKNQGQPESRGQFKK